MRLRNVPYARDKIQAYPHYIANVSEGDSFTIGDVYRGDRPLHVEVGAGKGRFMHTLAKRQPDAYHVAIEKFDSVIVRALERQIEDPQENLYLLRMDAEHLSAVFPEKSIDTLYLNFPDPWPKARHAKRRLTHPQQLETFASRLRPGGRLKLKTDNRGLFEYSIKQFNQLGWRFEFLSLDLHAERRILNIMTEFEERYSQNSPIYKLIARPKEETL